MPQNQLIAFDSEVFRKKIPSLSQHIGGIVIDLAACTPNPFDDLLAAQVPGAVQVLLERFVGPVKP